MRVALCGYGRAGKDTASRWFAQNTTLRYRKSTSEAAAPFVFRELHEKYGYASVEECWLDRHNHRDEWAALIWDYNKYDRQRLYREMIDGGEDVINGIREKRELIACGDIIQMSIWISRDGCHEDKTSCTVSEQDCTITVWNNKTKWHFYEKLRQVARPWGVLK